MTQVKVWQRPWLYEAQENALFTDKRYAVILASTKVGKTVGALVWLTEQAIQCKPGDNVWWVAPLYTQARMAFRRLKRFLPDGSYTANGTELTITLQNGVVITFKTARDPDALYGEDVYAVVMDEASRMVEESWHAVRSTLTATRGPARFIGNVKGTNNWVWQLSQRAIAEEWDDWLVTTLTAYDAVDGGVLELAEVEDAKRTLPPSVFEELYLAKPSENSRFFQGTPLFVDAKAVPSGAKVVRAWDFAVTEPKPGTDPDWTVGVKVAQYQGKTYIVDVVRVRAKADEVTRLFAATAAKDNCDQVIEEEKGGAGKMLVASMKSLAAQKGLSVAVRSAALTGDKETRAYMCAAAWNNGEVYVVDAEWAPELLDEFSKFPVGNRGHDDQVDAFAHAFNDISQRTYVQGSFRVPGSPTIL